MSGNRPNSPDKAYEVTRVIGLEKAYVTGSEEEIMHFRIEVLKDFDTQLFYARVCRLESFRVQPTFPLSSGVHEPGDEIICVEDFAAAWDKITGASEDEVVHKVRERIDEFFRLGGEHQR